MIDPKRFFFEYFYLYKKITNFDLTNSNWVLKHLRVPALYFPLPVFLSDGAERFWILPSKGLLNDSDKICLLYDLLDTIHNYLKGNWKAIRSYSDDLINNSLNNGELYDASLNLYWHGFPYIYQGSFESCTIDH